MSSLKSFFRVKKSNTADLPVRPEDSFCSEQIPSQDEVEVEALLGVAKPSCDGDVDSRIRALKSGMDDALNNHHPAAFVN